MARWSFREKAFLLRDDSRAEIRSVIGPTGKRCVWLRKCAGHLGGRGPLSWSKRMQLTN